MTLDIGVAKLRWEYVSLVWTKFCLQQRKNSFLLDFIEILQNCSYKSTFCASNLWPVICFPLSTALLHSSLLTRACASIVFFSILLKSVATVNCSFWTFFKNIFFFVQQKKRNSHSFGTTWGLVNENEINIGYFPAVHKILSNPVCLLAFKNHQKNTRHRVPTL